MTETSQFRAVDEGLIDRASEYPVLLAGQECMAELHRFILPLCSNVTSADDEKSVAVSKRSGIQRTRMDNEALIWSFSPNRACVSAFSCSGCGRTGPASVARASS
jgi:hypothetical protein